MRSKVDHFSLDRHLGEALAECEKAMVDAMSRRPGILPFMWTVLEWLERQRHQELMRGDLGMAKCYLTIHAHLKVMIEKSIEE